jgi:protease-4
MRKYLLFFTIFLMSIGTTAAFFNFDSTGKAAIIQLDGQITPSASSGAFSTTGITPQSVRALNERATEEGASAIIYEWNSGGGAVVASKEIMREIESVEVPTVCRFRDIAASGAYLGSLGCDTIVADSASLTGSIGVRSSYLEFSGTLDKLGIEYVNITSGEYKEVGSQYQNASEQDIQRLQETTDMVHQQFIDLVRENRNMSQQEVENVSTGELFLGSEAKEVKLVDRLGGRQIAVDEAENLSGKELNTFSVESYSGFSFLNLLTGDSWIKQFVSTDVPIKAEW